MASVPEPSSIILLLAGAACLLAFAAGARVGRHDSIFGSRIILVGLCLAVGPGHVLSQANSLGCRQRLHTVGQSERGVELRHTE